MGSQSWCSAPAPSGVSCLHAGTRLHVDDPLLVTTQWGLFQNHIHVSDGEPDTQRGQVRALRSPSWSVAEAGPGPGLTCTPDHWGPLLPLGTQQTLAVTVGHQGRWVLKMEFAGSWRVGRRKYIPGRGNRVGEGSRAGQGWGSSGWQVGHVGWALQRGARAGRAQCPV